MFGLFSSLKRRMSGTVVAKIDTEIMGGNCILQLQLKQSDSAKYVVLGSLTRGSYQYLDMKADEFERFVDAANQIREGLYAAVMPAIAPPSDPWVVRTFLKPNALGGFIWFLLFSVSLLAVVAGGYAEWFIPVMFAFFAIPNISAWLYKRFERSD